MTTAHAGPAPTWDVKFLTQAEIEQIAPFAWNPHRDLEIPTLVAIVDSIVSTHCGDRDAELSSQLEAITRVRALHVPWYEVDGVRHAFTVTAYGTEAPAGHDCTFDCLDRDGSPEDVEHQVLACSECRGTNPVYDDAVCHPFWPCPTIRALAPPEPST